MRFLANENIPAALVSALGERGHDVAWVRVDAPGSTDEVVLRRAVAEARLLLTFDKDFGELAFRLGMPATAGVVLLRFVPASPAQAVELVLRALDSREEWAGHFSVIEADRVRTTPLPSAEA